MKNRKLSNVTGLKVFVPSKEHEISTRFYKDLGFKLVWEVDDLKEFQLDGFGFLLQRFYEKEFADNLMLQLWVEDLESWWRQIEEGKLVEKYEGVKAKPPHQYPWGLTEIHLIDPSGVLWHIIQNKP
ncbi:MAG: VOC family protein [Puniceicoccales bacterium]